MDTYCVELACCDCGERIGGLIMSTGLRELVSYYCLSCWSELDDCEDDDW